MPEMPERCTSDEICLHAVAIDDSTTASSESTFPAASCCARRCRVSGHRHLCSHCGTTGGPSSSGGVQAAAHGKARKERALARSGLRSVPCQARLPYGPTLRRPTPGLAPWQGTWRRRERVLGSFPTLNSQVVSVTRSAGPLGLEAAAGGASSATACTDDRPNG